MQRPGPGSIVVWKEALDHISHTLGFVGSGKERYIQVLTYQVTFCTVLEMA